MRWTETSKANAKKSKQRKDWEGTLRASFLSSAAVMVFDAHPGIGRKLVDDMRRVVKKKVLRQTTSLKNLFCTVCNAPYHSHGKVVTRNLSRKAKFSDGSKTVTRFTCQQCGSKRLCRANDAQKHMNKKHAGPESKLVSNGGIEQEHVGGKHSKPEPSAQVCNLQSPKQQ